MSDHDEKDPFYDDPPEEDSGKACVCCKVWLPKFALMLLCGECFYSASKMKSGPNMVCSIHGGGWDPTKVAV